MTAHNKIAWEDQFDMQQVVSKTVDLVTRCANNSDPDNPQPRADLQALVDEHYHQDYEFRVIHLNEPDKETETYDREGYVNYHTSVAGNAQSIDRMCGAITLISHTHDRERGRQVAHFRNMVWSTMFWKSDLSARKVNFARMDWTFVRDHRGGEWKLLIWDDALQFNDW